MKEKGGFTLLELIIVVVIIGILGAIALPILITGTERARGAEGINLATQLRESTMRYYAEHEAYPILISDLDLTFDAPKYWNAPTCAAGTITITRDLAVKPGTLTLGVDDTLELTILGNWTSSTYPYAPTEAAP